MNILIGSNGGLTGVYLARNLKEISKEIKLYGCDSEKNSVGKFFVDNQRIISTSNAPNYVDELIEILNKDRIDIYFPTHSKEVKRISKEEKKIRNSTKCNFMVCPVSTFDALEDKTKAAQNLTSIGIPVPKQIEGVNCKYPIFMKRKVGSGGAGSVKIINSILHEAYLNSYEDIDFFEYIEGVEYTCDCLFKEDGELLGYNQRIREKTIGGAVSITKNDNSFDILPWIKKISDAWLMKGCVNFQYIIRENTPYFIDINLRFPSGGLPLTCNSGLDIPKIMVGLMTNNEMSIPKDFKPITKKRMYRFFEEIYEEE